LKPGGLEGKKGRRAHTKTQSPKKAHTKTNGKKWRKSRRMIQEERGRRKRKKYDRLGS